jgi:glycosyltransferase involved in cell wall biosynthesis
MLSFLLFGFWHIDRVIKATQPDICLNFFGIPCGPLALYIKKKYRIPYILCLRGGDVPGFSSANIEIFHKILSPLNRMIWREASRITANSHGIKMFAEGFYNEKEIKVIYNGVDTHLFKPLKLRKDEKRFRILYVGRIAADKNLVSLFEQIIPSLVHDDATQQVHFTIVGEGPLRQQLTTIARRTGTLERITFSGWVARGKLPEIYNKHDLFILPSLFEGMSNTVLEAKACGLPVVGFDIPGNQEMLESRKDIMVHNGNITELVMAIKRLLAQKNKENQDVSEEFVRKFSLDRVTEEFIKLIG